MNCIRLALLSSPLLAAVTGCAEGPEPFAVDDPASQARARDVALDHVLRVAPAALGDVDDVVVNSVFVDDFGGAHVRLQQTESGLPVLGGEAIVHLDSSGVVVEVQDRLAHGLDLPARPAVSRQDALDLAVGEVGGAATLSAEPVVDLVVNRLGNGAALVWRVQLEQMGGDVEPAMPVVFVDAKDGSIQLRYDNLQHVSLKDADKEAWDLKGGTRYSSAVLADSADAVANDAYVNSGLALAYYLAAHNRDSFDGRGAVVKNYVHYKRGYVNAFWNGSVLSYGDGDNVTSGPLVTLDIVAHELSHGVTEKTAALVYANESGALNEATSDIFAAAVEAAQAGATADDIWHIGEDCWNASPGHLRDMADPASTGDFDYYPTRYSGTSDNGGVHWNSGIANLFFQLLSDGGTHPRGTTSVVVPGIGISRAAAVWYSALTTRFTSGETFIDAREDTVAAAAAIDPDAVAAVNAAWDAVGVPLPPTFSTFNTSAPFSASRRASKTFSFTLPANVAARFTLAANNGDADLYVKFNGTASSSSFDCKSTTATSNESCTIAGKGAGTYNVSVYAYAAFSNAVLTVETAQ
jgi:bacillolysin